jgi:hypothetical protein
MYQPITAQNQQLYVERYHSNLNASAASGASTITLYSISQFAINQVLGIGEPGNEGSEIIKTHGSTAPTGSTVTLASNLTKSHPKDTPIYIIAFDQIQFFHSVTVDGTKTQLGSDTNIDPGQEGMIYEDTTYTSGYYFTRYKNSITGNMSGYSDPIPYAGFDQNTVGYAIDTALAETGAQINNTTLTYAKLISWTNQMLRLVRGKKKVWSNYQEFDYELGSVSMGVRRFAMPTTAYELNSNKSVLNVRVGDAVPLTYMDRSEYLQATENVAYTEVKTLAIVSNTSLVLDDTSDLDDSGSVDVYVSGTKYTVEYTANDKSTGTLTVATDQITYAFPVDSPVWQGIEENEVSYYSIWDGYLYLWPMITSDFEGQRILMDFYTDIDTVDSDADVITGPRFDMLIHYLKFKIRGAAENNAKEDLTDPSYIQFSEILRDAMRLEESGQINVFRPRGNAIYGGRARGRR